MAHNQVDGGLTYQSVGETLIDGATGQGAPQPRGCDSSLNQPKATVNNVFNTCNCRYYELETIRYDLYHPYIAPSRLFEF